MKKYGHKATIKHKLIHAFGIIRMAEITSEMFGGKSATNSMNWMVKLSKLDARKKSFNYDVLDIITDYYKYLTNITEQHKPSFLSGGIIAK